MTCYLKVMWFLLTFLVMEKRMKSLRDFSMSLRTMFFVVVKLVDLLKCLQGD